MITIKEKLYVTQEVNNIVCDYAKQIVLSELLMQFAFGCSEPKEEVTNLIERVSYYNGDLPPEDCQLELIELVQDFLKSLNKEKLTALHFWVLNQNIERYINEGLIDEYEDDDSIGDYYQKLGLVLTYKLDKPEENGLNDELIDALMQLLINFAAEFDLSSVDDDTIEHIVEELKHYTY